MNLFNKSLILYILSFIALVTSCLIWKQLLRKLSFSLLLLGGILHLTGIIARIVIMSRPPVATLYESIIFVAFIVVLFALFLEWKKQDGTGLITGSLLGAILHLIGTRYAAEGDTMGMLAAVLDTNFWLATHVITITIGYGCCFIAGVLGHIYLLRRWLYPLEIEAHKALIKNILGMGLIALFFSVLGTILGGIWADQSWGRFWGWDPKENGAMLICLWLIWLMHGKIAGIISPLYFALGMVFNNVVVALAWFGVNLLNIGLHSYGFANNTAMSLGLFCSGELLFMLVSYALISSKKKAGYEN